MRAAMLLLLAAAACEDGLPAAGDDDPACSEGCACTTDADCGDAHAVCIVGAHGSTCDCAAGYFRIDGYACQWAGVVGDPEFIAGAWTTSPGFTVEPAVGGDALLDPGGAVFPMDPCTSHVQYPTASQTVVMPRFSRAEPLQLNLHRLELNAAVASTDLRYGGAIAVHDPVGDYGATCLGAAAFAPETSTGQGAPVAFAVQFEAGCGGGPGVATVVLDHVDIGPADPAVCPAPNSVLGHADDDTGWLYDFDPEISGEFVGFVPYTGEDGTAGLQLAAAPFDLVSAQTAISVPVGGAAGNPSLRFYRSVETPHTGQIWSYDVGDETSGAWLFPISDVGPGVDTFCLPPATFGTVVPFVVAYEPTLVSGPMILDSVSVQPDPACGTDPRVADPGFESGHPMAELSSIDTQPRATRDPDAHGGAWDYQLPTPDCLAKNMSFEIIAPDVNPALRFWYRASTEDFRLSTPVLTTPFLADNAWHQTTTCLRAAPGGPATVGFQVTGAAATNCDGTALLAIDDFEAISDPACGATPP